MKTLRDLGEHQLLERLAGLLPPFRGAGVGIGDDTAVIPGEGMYDWLLTTDPVVEGRHFTPEHDGERIGHKAVGRVLSDIAAMGGEALYLLVDVTAPGDLPVERLEAVYRGISGICRTYDVQVVGGDLSGGGEFSIHVFGVGRVPKGKGILRSGAVPGDQLYVTGALGGSVRGRHLDFTPRLDVGRWLRENGYARAMIDVSDGLLTDLRHIMAASDTGALLELYNLPIAEAARHEVSPEEARDRALRDGEDFELLFAVPDDLHETFIQAWPDAFLNLPITRVGVITDDPGVLSYLNEQGEPGVFEDKGFEHFRT